MFYTQLTDFLSRIYSISAASASEINLRNMRLVWFLSYFLSLHIGCQSERKSKTVDFASYNAKAVGISLRANGKRYFVTSEMCSGGVFLTKHVNEDCLCYNGIFTLVRDCCDSGNTLIQSNTLAWRNDFQCGAPDVEEGSNPIHAILPLTKPFNRLGSVITPLLFAGNETSLWRKYDVEDIVIRNFGRLSLQGVISFQIINVKPLGREIRVRFGPETNAVICYTGWLTQEFHQILRITVTDPPPPGPTSNTCCFNITKENTPGVVTTDCVSGKVTTELIQADTSTERRDKCDQDDLALTQHTVKKRGGLNFSSNTIIPRDSPVAQLVLSRLDSLASYIVQEADDFVANDDFLGDRGPLLVKRQSQEGEPPNPDDVGDDVLLRLSGDSRNVTVIYPRWRGVSVASFKIQALAINEFIAILRNDPNVELREPETFRFKMLKKTFDVFLKFISNEIVPHNMLKTAFDVFYFLYEEQDPFLHTPPPMFEKTMKFLDNCLNIEQMLNFTTYGCPREIDQLVIDPIVRKKLETYYEGQPEELERVFKSLKHIEIRKDRRYIIELFDIYVEINWKVTDFVHSFCFEHFGDEFNAHHFYETELDKLFILPAVQKRWFTRTKDLRYVRGIFSTSNLYLRMKQLDKVAAVGHYLSRYNGSYWLYRPNELPIPWVIPNKGSLDDPKSAAKKNFNENTIPRTAFAQNILNDETKLSSLENAVKGRSGNIENKGERQQAYFYKIPEKLPAGELIWDGLAVCLHARYSNRQRYFVDNRMWGVEPALEELSLLYNQV